MLTAVSPTPVMAKGFRRPRAKITETRMITPTAPIEIATHAFPLLPIDALLVNRIRTIKNPDKIAKPPDKHTLALFMTWAVNSPQANNEKTTNKQMDPTTPMMCSASVGFRSIFEKSVGRRFTKVIAER